jgi:hypothetical protein
MTYFSKIQNLVLKKEPPRSHHKEVFKSQMAEIIKREKERERNVSLVQILKLGGIFL